MFYYNEEIEVQKWFYKWHRWIVKRRYSRNRIVRWSIISFIYYEMYLPDLLETVEIYEDELPQDEKTTKTTKEQWNAQEKAKNQRDKKEGKKETMTRSRWATWSK